MNLVRVISTVLDTIKRRIIKVRVLGLDDIQTCFESAPYGNDSNPIKDMQAVYAKTGDRGKTIIIGYINKNQLADIGENRMYATDSDGNLKFFIWLKNDGTCQLGGDGHNAVRYTPLNTGLQQLVDALQVQLGLIATGIAAGGGSYTPGTLTLDITDSRIDEIKTL